MCSGNVGGGRGGGVGGSAVPKNNEKKNKTPKENVGVGYTTRRVSVYQNHTKQKERRKDKGGKREGIRNHLRSERTSPSGMH